ncbi:MAG: acetyl xylan esterase [Ferruginibacter sp.]|uniref:glycosyl hydrolase n=1 Tax=Ferruginibacter sp. TaxID=1940288 RepID=UPI00265B130C|nr:glycosyl hydrolase [Ferruginibacter sp.]MDB5275730.1 acetyl xylan esterase [Ferruginibacter sp.]
MTIHNKHGFFFQLLSFVIIVLLYSCSKHFSSLQKSRVATSDPIKAGFMNPPESARPGVYWYFMDGNRTKESMTKDLESMKKAGIGNLVFLEVNVGVPRGKVDFLSEEWQDLFKHAVREAERLGIEITLGVGPGWTGSGGPWVPASQSMQHLVSSTLLISDTSRQPIKLPLPLPKKPYFGEGGFTPGLKKQWDDFYKDVAVLAFPTPAVNKKITDGEEKALYYRAPYSSAPGTKEFLPSLANYEAVPKDAVITSNTIIDLTNKLLPDGTLDWKAPQGKWTIMRFGSRNNGAVTRPAPIPGLGFEADKFDTIALEAHLNQYIGKLLKKIGQLDTLSGGGLKKIHMDSWEMGAQNWTAQFRQQFIKRRGYDPLPFYPVYDGNIVGSLEISERFLWDLRQTSQELVLENHAQYLKTYAHRHGWKLSIEPYDMNPAADLELGAVADIPMCEFWSKAFGFNSSFSCAEATSIAHVNGIPLVPAEAFTADDREGWKQYPGSMKEQGDWAFAAGINRFVYHTFQSQTLPDNLKPGMTMGPYGVHWNRSQTWWPMVGGYHNYISRCQFVLQQGRAVADILYLTPEGAPHVFRPPHSALIGEEPIRDRRGFNFDGCSPGQLLSASVKDNQVVFPGGAAYKILVLPAVQTMTPALLEKIKTLVYEGAIVVGSPPMKSPGLSGYPACDEQVKQLAQTIWGTTVVPDNQSIHTYGKGKVVWGKAAAAQLEGFYPNYDFTAALLKDMQVVNDFESAASLRYTHRITADQDIYFVSNKASQLVNTTCLFRSQKGRPELWDPLTGEIKILPEFSKANGQTSIPLHFDAYQSFFIVFKNDTTQSAVPEKTNFPVSKNITTLNAAWTVSFDPDWGGPKKITFDSLIDWTKHPEQGIKYYSGIATYKQAFDVDGVVKTKNNRLYLDLGEVKNIARVKLNGKDLGVVWTAPWKVEITSAVKEKNNHLEIEVANLWPNRLIGDEQFPDDGIKNEQWPDWLLKGQPRTSGRFTFTTFKHYEKGAPLFKSGLIGPVTIQQAEF